MSYIITIINQKGGVGKTTTAVNLSACLADRGFKTLLIDGDPQCNASISMGYPLKRTDNNSLFNFLTDREEDLDYSKIIKKTNCKFDMIRSCDSLYSLDLLIVNMPKREFLFKNRLQRIKNEYDYIILDAPPNLGILAVNLMTASFYYCAIKS
jgi:chromosome partitioning protein